MKKLIALVVAFAALGIGGWFLWKSRGAAPKPPATGPAVAAEVPTFVTPAGQAMEVLRASTAEVAKVLVPGGAKLAPAVKAQRVGQVLDAMTEMQRTISREAWDPAAVVASVGKDRAALFTWVRDKTALVPYRGSLRGPVGVMMDRVGNSLDRALLLGQLLALAGLEVQLANAALEPAVVEQLAKTWSSRPRPTLPTEPGSDASVAQLLQQLGVDKPAFEAARAKGEAAQRDLVAKTRARIQDQTAALAKLVPATGAVAPPDTAAFADHWWVQVQDGDAWIDLDPSLPDAVPGRPLAVATETLRRDALGDDRRHTLTVRVIGEVWHGEAREEAKLVEHTFAPADFYGQRISITTVPIDMPAPNTLRADKHPAAAARAALTAQTEWVAMLKIGAIPMVKMSVTDGGELHDLMDAHGNTNRLARVVQQATKAGVGGATDLLDQLPDDGAGAAPPAKPPLAERSGFTAQWIEYELRAPGAETRVVRREVFDAFRGAPDRSAVRPRKLSDEDKYDRGLALIGETELLPMFARIPEAFVADLIIKPLTTARGPLIELAGLDGKPASTELHTRLAQLAPVPGPVYALALARFAWSPVGAQVYLDRLDLITARSRLVAAGNELRTRDVFDIVNNETSVWPTPGVDPRLTRIAQGITDTAAESLLLRCPGGPGGCIRGSNTSDVFAVSRPADWTVVDPRNPEGLGKLSLPARTQANADLAAGYALVVAPERTTGRSGPTWWRVRGDTGETLGKGSHGGNAYSETVILQLTATGIAYYYCVVNSSSGPRYDACYAGTMVGLFGAFLGLETTKIRFVGYALTVLGLIIVGESDRPD